MLRLTSGDPKEDSMLVYYIYNAFPPFLAARKSTRNWRRMTSFVSLLPRKRSSVPVRFHRLNYSSVVAIVAEIVETTIFLLAREIEYKIYKGGIVWISECYPSKMSSHVILSYPPGSTLLVFLGCAESAKVTW